MLDVAAFNDFQAGGVGADRMAATTAAVVDGVATLRAQDKLAAVENGAAHQALLIILLCQEFLADDTAVRIAGPNGAAWIQVTKEDIQGEFSCKVEGGSTRALNPATRAQRGIQTIQTVIPTIQQLGYDPTNALRMALRDMGYDPNYLLQPIEQPLESQDPEALAPDMAQAQPQVDPMAGKAALDQLFSDPGMAPVDQVAQGFGGPGVPGASSGGLQL
jgi:hypothetical protein